MALVNRPGGLLVTRGLGGEPTNLVVRGFLPFLQTVADVVRGAKIVGRRKAKEIQELFEEIKISVALLAINGKDLASPIINKITTTFIPEPAPEIQVIAKKLSIKQPEIIVEAEIRRKNVLKD